MKFKDKDGNVFEDIENEVMLFCDRHDCGDCPIIDASGKDDCYQWAADNPAEAARLMGYEVVEDEGKAPHGWSPEAKQLYRDVMDSLREEKVSMDKQKQKTMEWISVKDRLPQDDEMVLVIANGKPSKNVTLIRAYELAEYDPEGWILEMWPEWMDADVTHWMPLPEPPKEDTPC